MRRWREKSRKLPERGGERELFMFAFLISTSYLIKSRDARRVSAQGGKDSAASTRTHDQEEKVDSVNEQGLKNLKIKARNLHSK